MSEPTPQALELHAQACRRGEDGYFDPESGLFVASSHLLRRRGHCCGLGCRHCPFDPEQRRVAGRPGGSAANPGLG